MRQVNKKLGSRTGASIMAALLLFLVCAILASVVLAAATAASGKMSQMPEIDRRYYAVTSASEMLKDMLDEKSVSIISDTDNDGTKGLYLAQVGSGEAVSNAERRKITGAGDSPVTDSIQNYAAYEYYRYKATSGGTTDPGNYIVLNQTFYVAANVDASDEELRAKVADAVQVTITETVYSNGSIVFVVSSGTETEKEPFEQRITFAAQEERLDKDGDLYALSLTWKLYKIETISSPPTVSAPGP